MHSIEQLHSFTHCRHILDLAQGMELNEGAQEDKTGQVEEVPAVTLPQQKSKVVKPGEKRSKKGKRRINSGLPPPLAPDDYVKVVPVSKQSEVGFQPSAS